MSAVTTPEANLRLGFPLAAAFWTGLAFGLGLAFGSALAACTAAAMQGQICRRRVVAKCLAQAAIREGRVERCAKAGCRAAK